MRFRAQGLVAAIAELYRAEQSDTRGLVTRSETQISTCSSVSQMDHSTLLSGRTIDSNQPNSLLLWTGSLQYLLTAGLGLPKRLNATIINRTLQAEEVMRHRFPSSGSVACSAGNIVLHIGPHMI